MNLLTQFLSKNLNIAPLSPKLEPIPTTQLAHQVIAESLKPLCDENPHMIRNTQDFPDLLKNQPLLEPNEEYVSYDVESLFTNIPIKDAIDYILDQTYCKHKLKAMFNRLVFKRLLEKLTKFKHFYLRFKIL